MTWAALELLLWVRGASRNGSCALSPQPAAVTTRAARPAATPSRFLRSFITCPLGVPVGTQVYQCGISHRARGLCALRISTQRGKRFLVTFTPKTDILGALSSRRDPREAA